MSNIHKRGFASMSPERRSEVSRKGGQNSGGNFKHDRERARILGRKGGLASKGEMKYEKLQSEPKE